MTLQFDQNVTTSVAVDGTAAVFALLQFTPALTLYDVGVTCVGQWTTQSTLTLWFTFPSLTAAADNSTLQIKGTTPLRSDWTAWNVGALSVLVRQSAGLKSAGGESAASNSSRTVSGSWGDAVTVTVTSHSSIAAQVSIAASTTQVECRSSEMWVSQTGC